MAFRVAATATAVIVVVVDGLISCGQNDADVVCLHIWLPHDQSLWAFLSVRVNSVQYRAQ